MNGAHHLETWGHYGILLDQIDSLAVVEFLHSFICFRMRYVGTVMKFRSQFTRASS